MVEGSSQDGGEPGGLLEPALMKVVKALIFDHQPLPELDILPLAQLRLLWTVYYLEDATMKTFSDRLYVSQSTVTQLAERLVRRGLIDRMHDLQDRRVVRLRVSEAARKVLSTVAEHQHQTMHKVWAQLNPTHKAMVLEGLEVLFEAVQVVKREEHIEQPEGGSIPHEKAGGQLDSSQPVVDLLSRRIRGAS